MITTDLLLSAYCQGVFPMADSRDEQQVFWYDPKMRGIIPLDKFHIPTSLKKSYRKMKYQITMDKDFAGVINACALARESTWINEQIEQAYIKLYKDGFAHSVEVWDQEKLIGGLYGVSIKGAFFGESMFSKATNASKYALINLVEHLNDQGFYLLDTQFINDHLKQFGAIEIARDEYHKMLEKALAQQVGF